MLGTATSLPYNPHREIPYKFPGLLEKRFDDLKNIFNSLCLEEELSLCNRAYIV